MPCRQEPESDNSGPHTTSLIDRTIWIRAMLRRSVFYRRVSGVSVSMTPESRNMRFLNAQPCAAINSEREADAALLRSTPLTIQTTNGVLLSGPALLRIRSLLDAAGSVASIIPQELLPKYVRKTSTGPLGSASLDFQGAESIGPEILLEGEALDPNDDPSADHTGVDADEESSYVDEEDLLGMGIPSLDYDDENEDDDSKRTDPMDLHQGNEHSEMVRQWEDMQKKTFTNWVNVHLSKVGRSIEDIGDLYNGVQLLHLLSSISEEPVPKHVPNPKSKFQCIENLNTALRFIQEHKVRLYDVGSTEIYDRNMKMTLGMLWCLILRFVVSGLSQEGQSARDGLLLWCKRKTRGYDNVNIKDFGASFADGLAFCALIHAHRPELIEYKSLSADDRAHNLTQSFDVAETHLGVPHLLDVDDMLKVATPDERSVMTYVAQLYRVFSNEDRKDGAAKLTLKFIELMQEIDEMKKSYEERTEALLQEVMVKAAELNAESEAGQDSDGPASEGRDLDAPPATYSTTYDATKAAIRDFREYRRDRKRQWVGEQGDLATLFTQIQAKLAPMKRPHYLPLSYLMPSAVELEFEGLNLAERKRRAALNQALRAILENLRRDFAERANAFYDAIIDARSVLAGGHRNLALLEQLHVIADNQAQLTKTGTKALPAIFAAERACEEANIEDNEYTDHTAADLEFEYQQAIQALAKAHLVLGSQISASEQRGISPAQLEDYKSNFDHFDDDHDGALNRREFKGLLSALGLVALDFDGSDSRADEIYIKITNHSPPSEVRRTSSMAAIAAQPSTEGVGELTFDMFISYILNSTSDLTSPEVIRNAFLTISDNNTIVTRDQLKKTGFSDELIAYIASRTEPGPEPGTFDLNVFLSGMENEKEAAAAGDQAYRVRAQVVA